MRKDISVERGSRPTRMYCIPHAGAGVSAFGHWPARLGSAVQTVPVLLPGRDGRRRERRVTDRRSLLADLMRTVGPPPAQPYVIYGHSLGALIAYTVTRAWEEAGLNPPALVAVGACPPPDASAAFLDGSPPSDDRLVALMKELCPAPELNEPDGLWLRATLPVLRDDLRLAAALRAAADEPLRSPLLVVSGRADALAPPRAMADWRHWSSGPVVERTLPGTHFFVRGRELPALLGRACRVVRRVRDRTGAATTTTVKEMDHL